MTEGQYRVAVWSTGGIGSIAIRAIHERPNLDLVGVWVHSPEKDGMDAGELANGEPIGLAVTTDLIGGFPGDTEDILLTELLQS